jgi:hypothetical protein
MGCKVFLILAFFGFLSIAVFGQDNIRVSKWADTIRVDPEKVEGDSNYTALNCSSGLYVIGDTLIDLSGFKIHQEEIELSALHFDKKFTVICLIRTRGQGGYESDYKEDTVVVLGRKKQLKKLRTPPSANLLLPEYSFKSNCPPMVCGRYYLAADKKHVKVEIRSPNELSQLVPEIKTEIDAFFLIDDRAFQKGKFQRVNDGYLILVNKVVSQCRIQYADLLYHVSFAGKITALGQNITQVTRLCY